MLCNRTKNFETRGQKICYCHQKNHGDKVSDQDDAGADDAGADDTGAGAPCCRQANHDQAQAQTQAGTSD